MNDKTNRSNIKKEEVTLLDPKLRRLAGVDVLDSGLAEIPQINPAHQRK